MPEYGESIMKKEEVDEQFFDDEDDDDDAVISSITIFSYEAAPQRMWDSLRQDTDGEALEEVTPTLGKER